MGKETLNFAYDVNTKFYKILFGEGNETIAERIISDLDKMNDYSLIYDPAIYKFMEERKISGFERLVTKEDKIPIQQLDSATPNKESGKEKFEEKVQEKKEEKVEEKKKEKVEVKHEEKA